MLEAEGRLWFGLGRQLRDARLAKRLTVAELALRAQVSTDLIYLLEAGRTASTEAVVRVVAALSLRLEFELSDPRRREARPSLSVDVVHSAMGEMEAAHFMGLGVKVGLDEPYQHYQFAGRADLVAWDVDARALLHIENRTRFPDFQEMAGAFNAKREYLADALATRTGVTTWRSQTHVIAALWSSEVLHALRLRTASFRALCPDSAQAFEAWWEGEPPTVGARKVLVVLDPAATGRQRVWISLDEALSARPRHRDYADAAAQAAATTAERRPMSRTGDRA